MTIFTHGLVTYAGIQVLGITDVSQVILAFSLGVAVDLDHVIKVPLFLKKTKRTLPQLATNYPKSEKHYNWRTPLQEPVALLWAIPLSLFFGSIYPALLLAVHLLMDYMMGYPKRPFYPYSSFITTGILGGVKDSHKEVLVAMGALCVILLVR